MYNSRTRFTRYLSVIISLALLGIMWSCDPTVHCPSGVFIEFNGIDFMQGIRYSVSRDDLSIWLTTTQVDKKGRKCIPRNLSVKNMSAPEVCNIGYIGPAHIKGRPLMALYVYNVSQMRKNDFIEFDLYQKEVKKQTVRISVDLQDASKVVVTIDGDSHVADLSR
jgi:hypothetical protein